MIEIKFMFPVKEDAHKANYKICQNFAGSKAYKNNNIVITPVDEDHDKKDNPIWYFFINLYQNSEDTTIEKHIELSGGLLNIVNRDGHDVWAFA